MPQPWGLDVGDLQIGRRKRLERVVLRHERGIQAVAGIAYAPSYPWQFATGAMPRASSDSLRTSRHLPKTCLSSWSSMAVKTTVRESELKAHCRAESLLAQSSSFSCHELQHSDSPATWYLMY